MFVFHLQKCRNFDWTCNFFFLFRVNSHSIFYPYQFQSQSHMFVSYFNVSRSHYILKMNITTASSNRVYVCMRKKMQTLQKQKKKSRTINFSCFTSVYNLCSCRMPVLTSFSIQFSLELKFMHCYFAVIWWHGNIFSSSSSCFE